MPETLQKTATQLGKEREVLTYDSKVGGPTASKEEVERRLQSTSESISSRLDIIQDEISSTGDSIRKAISENPVVAVGLCLAAGVVVGMIAGGRGKSSSPVSRSVITGLAAAIEDALDDGADSGEAVRSALADIEPYLKPPGTPKRGAFSTVARTAARAGFAMLLRQGVNSFLGTDNSDS